MPAQSDVFDIGQFLNDRKLGTHKFARWYLYE